MGQRLQRQVMNDGITEKWIHPQRRDGPRKPERRSVPGQWRPGLQGTVQAVGFHARVHLLLHCLDCWSHLREPLSAVPTEPILGVPGGRRLCVYAFLSAWWVRSLMCCQAESCFSNPCDSFPPFSALGVGDVVGIVSTQSPGWGACWLPPGPLSDLTGHQGHQGPRE